MVRPRLLVHLAAPGGFLLSRPGDSMLLVALFRPRGAKAEAVLSEVEQIEQIADRGRVERHVGIDRQ